MKNNAITFRLFSAMLVLALCFGSFVPCLASVVKVPVFSSAPEDVTFISGTVGLVRASASVFSDTKTEIRYYLEVLKGDSFVSQDVFSTGKSGFAVNIKITTGKGEKLLSHFGTYTARVRAVSLDPEGFGIAEGYSPVFEIEVLPPFVRSVKADAKVSYGEPLNITAEINPLHENRENVRYMWTVFDGERSAIVKEGDTAHGITFTGTDTPVLHTQGCPDGFFTLGFTLSVFPEDAVKQEISEKVFVDFRKEKTFGFSLGEDGMKYFRGDGQYVTGWLRTEDGVYYFDTDGFMVTGETVIDGKRCYFSFDGKMICGFIKTPLGLKYYENGKIIFGWHTAADGTEYYFESYTGYMTAKKDTSGKTLYFTDYGARAFRTGTEN